MNIYAGFCLILLLLLILAGEQNICESQSTTGLPEGIEAVWDIDKAYREKTNTRERICINGLWQWQPIESRTEKVPEESWGYLKVPGTWPNTNGGYMWRESQTYYPHPDWENDDLRRTDMAWYQREFTIPDDWTGRRIFLYIEYLNSYAAVYIDGTNLGEIYFPGGEVDISSACRPGSKHILSLYVVAMPLNAEIISYADAGGGRTARGRVARRGLCGDVFLVGTSTEERIADIKIDTSVRQWEIKFDTEFSDLKPDRAYSLMAQITDNGQEIERFRSQTFKISDLKEKRFAFVNKWKPDKLWDVHTPQNMYELHLSLLDSEGEILDTYQTTRFGFREFWIDERDFKLNGTRIYCFAVPFDNAQIGTTAACYDGARETMRRLKILGINAVYTHNYDCLPGSHLSFSEILRAADDTGILISLSQPHVKDYDWKSDDADATNGYARHAEFYVRQAQNHPSVVMYSMNHNMTGYSEDMNPDRIDGIYNPAPDPEGKSELRTDRSAKLARRGEVIVRNLDSSRVIYHHSSGNNGQMHTSNFYINFVPIQERSDWFEHWSTEGVKPVFLCEYGIPLRMSWVAHRGWYKGKRSWTNGKLPHQFFTAEWGAQFLGDQAFKLTEQEKRNLRFEHKQWQEGKTWFRWDYPFQVNNTPALGIQNIDDIQAMYITDNWRAYRTWELSAFNIWSYGNKWKLRDGVDKSRKSFDVDWDNIQRPGYIPDFIERRYERIDTAFELSDWIPTKTAEAFVPNNQPVLAYIAGKPSRFTSKDHNFHPGETVEKQIIVINNSRETISCDCAWSFNLPDSMSDSKKISVRTGKQERILLQFKLPDTLKPGEYELTMSAKLSSGEMQRDSFAINVLTNIDKPELVAKLALFDPKGETAELLDKLGVAYDPVDADSDLSSYSILIVGKEALEVGNAAPDINNVRDGLKVLMFEQKPDVLEKRLGFRIQEYGLRRVFKRIPDHPALTGLDAENLRDWRGAATIVPPRLTYETRPMYGPTIEWCGIKVTRPWRCGNYGNLATVLIEKPAIGDFLPIIDGGFGLQYSPLMEYREGSGMIMFCQMDVTERTEDDPAAMQLAANVIEYVCSYLPSQHRKALYAGNSEGKKHLEQSGVAFEEYNGKLESDQVLVVGPDSSAQLAPYKDNISKWLKSDGRILAIGLNEQEASAFLPSDTIMKNEEHICTYFDAASMNSPFAGISPAEVQIRAPQQVPLITGGAEAMGNGVLAVAEDGNVVFCQLAPWQFDYEKLYNVKMTYKRISFLVARLLANMGVSSNGNLLLSRFSTPVDMAAESSDNARYLAGLYLEKPVEMDDPYRFFRW